VNLGVASELLGRTSDVLKYYQQSRDLYQQMGDERRAAEQEANSAGLLVDHGSNQDETLRRIRNARATFQKLGHMDFVVFTMEMEAASHTHAGRHGEGRRQLLEALSRAKERKLATRVVSITVRLANSYITTSEYEPARTLLEEAAKSDAGQNDLDVAVTLARLDARLGDFDNARERLARALAGIKMSGQNALLPLVYTALGELEYEAGAPERASSYFEKSGDFWIDDLPDAASVEAKCYQGMLDARARNAQAAERVVQNAMAQARNMGRLDLEARCRIQLARVYYAERRFTDVVGILDGIPLEGDRTVGGEVQAEVHYWRSRAAAARGDRDAYEAEAALSHKLVDMVRSSLPETFRERFWSKASIREVVQE
jgi:tetratricopeptide (TPR) repeat protein